MHIRRYDEKLFFDPGFDDWVSGVRSSWTVTGGGTVTEESTDVVVDKAARITGTAVLSQVGTPSVGSPPVTDPPWIPGSSVCRIRIFVKSIGAGSGVLITIGASSFGITAGQLNATTYTLCTGMVGPVAAGSNINIQVTNCLIDAMGIYLGSQLLEPMCIEYDPLHNPYDLLLTPNQAPIRNDLTGVGDPEAKAYCREYYVGDGITTDFPLRLPIYGTDGKPLLEDDFTEAALDLNHWSVVDPTVALSLFGGSLNVNGGLGLNHTVLLNANGVQIAGKLRVHAGEFQFVHASDGIVGGLFTNKTPPVNPNGLPVDLTLTNCMLGWRFTKNPSGSTTTHVTENAFALAANETPAGAMDGVNIEFVLKNQVGDVSTLRLYWNQKLLKYLTDYLVGLDDRTLIVAAGPPQAGDTLLASYSYQIPTSTVIAFGVFAGTDGVTSQFLASHSPKPGTLTVSVNGTALLNVGGKDYSVSGRFITLTSLPVAGSIVSFDYDWESGDQTDIQAIVNGVLIGDVITTRAGKSYAPQIFIDAGVQTPLHPPWYSLHSKFGGTTDDAPVQVIFKVEEYDTTEVKNPVWFQTYEVTLTDVIPAFLYVGALSVVDMHCVINYFEVTQPMQGTLLTRNWPTVSNALVHKNLGFVGEDDTDATISVNNQSATLSFFKEARPVGKTLIEFAYREAGPTVVRFMVSG